MPLILALCDERISPEQIAELERLLRASAKVRKLYFRLMQLHAGLHHYGSALGAAAPGDDSSGTPGLGSRARDSQQAIRSSTSKTALADLPAIDPSAHLAWAGSSAWRIGIAFAAILLLGLLIATAWMLRGSRSANQNSNPQQNLGRGVGGVNVATITAVVNLGPTTPTSEFRLKQLLVPGQVFDLEHACIELSLTGGGRAVIEAPAEFKFVSSTELFLSRGNIEVRIPGGGFVVRTPTAIVTDLGTEFGVAVGPAGMTHVDVFEGKVAVTLAAPTKNAAAGVLLSSGQAAVVTVAAVKIDPAGAVAQRFLSHLNSPINALDVTDLVSGGDGSTHRRGNAIDAITGEAGVLGVVEARSGDHRFHPVPTLPVIDGCFVPDGSNGSMQVDSSGDGFLFPATSNLSFNRIWTGGVIPWNTPRGISSVLQNVDYSTPEHAILCIHSNNGLTLDLAAVRRLYPNRKITAFSCSIGNSYVNGSSDETGVNPRADAFVIVDGTSRFEKRRFTNQDGIFNVDVPFNANDRFLTLATTDGGDGINDDWVLWVDAVLRMSQ
ncbi:MAG: NPCBM/NEW2 domain-containing protein [Tepidisphaeraceae bacterium]